MSAESILQIAAIVFGAGIFYAKLGAIQKDIKRLEEKQERYNQLQERTHTLELWKEYHEREHERGNHAKI